MQKRVTMVYWKGERFWLGKLLEHPDIMTQGETVEELEENLRDAYQLMVMDDVPEDYQTKEIAVCSGPTSSASSNKPDASSSGTEAGTISI
jgi:predicted RNase H-like HicB family nuclease